MCKAMEDMRNEALEEGRAEGRAEGQAKERTTNIREMLLDNVPIDKIRQYTKATDEEILNVRKKL